MIGRKKKKNCWWSLFILHNKKRSALLIEAQRQRNTGFATGGGKAYRWQPVVQNDTDNATTTSHTDDNITNGLEPGYVALIVIGSIVVVAVIIGSIVLILRYQRLRYSPIPDI